MPETTYRIFQREDQSFAVEIARVGALRQTAAGFATEADAKGWIAQDKRLSVGAEAVSAPGPRRWRGR